MSPVSRLAVCAALFTAPGVYALPSVIEPSPPFTPSGLAAVDVAADGRAISLMLPDGKAYVVNGTRQRFAGGRVGLAGRSPNGSERLYAFVEGDRVLSADVYGRFGHYEMVQSGDDAYWVRERTGPGRADELDARNAAQVRPPRMPLKAAPGADGNYEIRVLVLFTPLASERLGGSEQVAGTAQRVLFLASSVMETSLVPVRYTLAAVAPFSGTSEDDNYYANLDAMVASSEVRGLRDQTEADLVLLIRSQDGNPTGNGGTVLCGLSNGFNNFERSDPPLSVDPDRDGFNVAGLAPGEAGNCFDDVVAHEFGHSLAGGHDYASSAGFEYWKPYSHALVCRGSSGEVSYFSLMWGSGVGPGGGRADLITNPALLLDGQACGLEGVPGAEATQANNARATTEAAPYVAAYRGAGTAARGDTGPGAFGGSSLPLAASALLGLLGLFRRAVMRRRADRCSQK